MDIPDQNSTGPQFQTTPRWRWLLADKSHLILVALVCSAAVGGLFWALNRSGISSSTATIVTLLALLIHSQFRIRQLESKLKDRRVEAPNSGTG